MDSLPSHRRYEVNSLYTPTFRLSLLSINQFDTAGYTSTFGLDMCSISSPSITIAVNRVHDLYLISPTTALTSTVPSMSTMYSPRRGNHNRTIASSSAHTTVPSIAHSTPPTTSPLHTAFPSAASTVPSITHSTEPTSSTLHTASPSAASTVPSIMHCTELTSSPLHTASPGAPSTVPQCPSATEFPKPTQNPLPISESQLWHRLVAHINPTALQSLIDEYTKDDSMCTACIQAKHNQNIIKVKTKHTTMPFELVHSAVFGPLSTPTTAGHCYYILFIDDYTIYTSVWVLPDMKSNTCTSACQSLQARVDCMGYEVKPFRCDNGCRANSHKTFRQMLTACGTTYEQHPPYAHHYNGVAERLIQTITAKAQ